MTRCQNHPLKPTDLKPTYGQLTALTIEIPLRTAPQRLERLSQLARFIAEQPRHEPVNIMFICTHNSRRSHIAQIWAQIAAAEHNLTHVQTFSGGTERTRFEERAIRALESMGLKFEKQGNHSSNPVYRVIASAAAQLPMVFSKTIEDASNPSSGFAAVMTCEEADEACPFVRGANYRLALPYLDPKRSDNTPQESETYTERCWEIATEMWWVMSEAAALGNVGESS